MRGWPSRRALNALTVYLQLSWRTVAAIIARVVADLTGKVDQLEGLTRIGIDEIAYRKGCESTIYKATLYTTA